MKNPQIVGFGIKDNETFNQATEYQKGAIIGSAFVKFLNGNRINEIGNFVAKINKA